MCHGYSKPSKLVIEPGIGFLEEPDSSYRREIVSDGRGKPVQVHFNIVLG